MVAELKDTLPDDMAQMVERLHVGGLQKPENDRCIALIERLSAERDSYKSMLKEQWAAGVPPDCVVVSKKQLHKAYQEASWNAYDQRCAHTLRDMIAAAWIAMYPASTEKPTRNCFSVRPSMSPSDKMFLAK